MIDRLCAMADMPKPRVGIADTAIPERVRDRPLAGPRGRRASPPASWASNAEELEGVLAHEPPRRAPRRPGDDGGVVSAGILAGMLTQGAQYGAIFGGEPPRQQQRRLPIWLVVLLVSMVVYAVVSFALPRCCSRYREMSADRAGAYLTMKPQALASALQKITGEMQRHPDQGPAGAAGHERLLHRPGRARASRCARSPRPTRRWSSGWSRLAEIQADLAGVPPDGAVGLVARTVQAQAGEPRRALRRRERRHRAGDHARAGADR